MLTEERYAIILKLLDEKHAITVPELTKTLNASESTVRRDLSTLHKSGQLHKVYGGATSILNKYSTNEDDIHIKKQLNIEEKKSIARYAANLIERNDFVYIDAGTTTELMIDYITEKNATFITNGFLHAGKLADRGFKTFIIAGHVKRSTAAIIGTESINSLSHYNFTKGFFGVNGISTTSGFSTPDTTEGSVKSFALSRCKKAFVLADSSKFNKISPVTFSNISCATIITTPLEDRKFREYTTIIEVQ